MRETNTGNSAPPRRQENPEWYDHITGLEGLPGRQQGRHYHQAFREVAWGWRLLYFIIHIVAILVAFELADLFSGSRWNPAVPRVVVAAIFGATSALAMVWAMRWFDRRVIAPRVWRNIPELCDSCGYDLTGNTSGICPECGSRGPRATEDSSEQDG